MGLCLFVFAKEDLTERITKVEADAIKLGYPGTLGNKGATVIRLYVDDTSLCFLNCYFEGEE